MHEEFKEDIKKIIESQKQIEIGIVEIKKDLKYHIIRTDANERRIEKLEYVLIGLAAAGVLGGLFKTLF